LKQRCLKFFKRAKRGDQTSLEKDPANPMTPERSAKRSAPPHP